MTARGSTGPPRMPSAEWEVMRCCWQLGRPTVPEILEISARYGCERKEKRYETVYKTVQVLCGRLAEKGCLRIDRRYRYNKYIPLVDHHEALRAETEHFIAEVVGNGVEEIELVIGCLKRAREGAWRPRARDKASGKVQGIDR